MVITSLVSCKQAINYTRQKNEVYLIRALKTELINQQEMFKKFKVVLRRQKSLYWLRGMEYLHKLIICDRHNDH